MRMVRVWVRMHVVMRMQSDERYGRCARCGRGHRGRRHGGQCQHVLRRGQLLGKAPGRHGRGDPVRVGHLVVHDGRRRRWLYGGRSEQAADGPQELRGRRCGRRQLRSVQHGGGCDFGRARLLGRLSDWLTALPGHCWHRDPNPVRLARWLVVGRCPSVGRSVGAAIAVGRTVTSLKRYNII